MYAVSTQEFVKDKDGNLKGLVLVETEFINGKFQPVLGSEKEIPANLVLLAMGFTGPEKSDLLTQLEVELDERGIIKRDGEYATSAEGVYVCGDAGRGQSLIVWAIAEGRSAAAAVDTYLSGHTQLPSPIEPTARPLMV
jgi:glutamate synthase (NADPH/NADH) small chain